MIIGISGLANSGKDTCADFLVGRYNFKKMSFADPMKQIVCDVFGFTDEQLYGPSEMRNAPDKRYPRKHGPWIGVRCKCCGHDLRQYEKSECYLTPRFVLQQLGSEWGRVCYPNVWVELAIRNAGHGDVVIPDVRFKNEIEALRKVGAKLIRVVRQNAGLSGVAGQHVSETEQSSMSDELFDSVIFNNKGLDTLEEAVGFLMKEWS